MAEKACAGQKVSSRSIGGRPIVAPIVIDSPRQVPGAEFEDWKGVLSVAKDGFPAAIAEIRERLGDKPLLLAGMIGSNRGWMEAPYVPCPAGHRRTGQGLVRPGKREAIVPGVSYVGDGRADVMRGEEVQLLGAVAPGTSTRMRWSAIPGTHNKWTRSTSGRIHSFRTVMTGELFSLLKEHSILVRPAPGQGARRRCVPRGRAARDR